MEKDIVFLKDNELVVGTWELSVRFGIKHRATQELIKKYTKDFEELGALPFVTERPKSATGGGVIKQYLLNEEQYVFLTTLFSNNEKVRKHKKGLSIQFVKMRRYLIRMQELASVQKFNEEWLEKRSSGKIERRIETDTIKEFIEYAKKQGSKNADKYYMSISKMENSCLFSMEILQMEFPNLREVVSGFALDALKMCDHLVGEELKDGMSKNLSYKDIFVKAKERVEKLALVLGKLGIEKGLMVQFQQKQIA